MEPDHLKIGWRNYKIDYDSLVSEDDEYGQIIYVKKAIRILRDLDKHEKRVTLLHEFFHGILYSMGSSLRKDEDLVIGLAENTYKAMQDNPKVFEWLLNKE